MEFSIPQERFEALDPLLAQVVKTNGSVTFARDIHEGPERNYVDLLARHIATIADAVLDSRPLQILITGIAGAVIVAVVLLA